MELSKKLFDFIEQSPTACHTVQSVRERLLSEGFEELFETASWDLKEGGKYFTTRSMTSVIAFKLPKKSFSAFSIVAPHGDSPCFKVKASPEMRVDGKYTKLNTEVYGGMTLNLWIDRPLSVAGRLVVKTESGVKAVLTDIRRDLLIIPGLAIHLNREVNNGVKLDPQKDTLPLFGGGEAELLKLAAEAAGVDKDDILSYDLYLYNRARGTVLGAEEEFIAAPKLDDLECVFSAVTAFLQSENEDNCTVCAVFDNEEIGSLTRQGADSTFLSDTLSRICEASGKSESERIRAIAGGFMLSADNAHAVHPNSPEVSDPTSRCYLNEGVVIKHSTRYATDAVTAAAFKKICDTAGVPTQTYFNNSRQPGGSTLGNISGSHVSIPTVDIGLPQLSMHSPYETAGKADIEHMINAMTAFYSSRITLCGDGEYEINKEKTEEPEVETVPFVEAEPEVTEEITETAEETAEEIEEVIEEKVETAEIKEETKINLPAKKAGWQNNTVFYQFYPLGFCGAPHENDGYLLDRIKKVTLWIPHLKKMNVGAVYFSPVFDSDRHGYDTRDYTKIDCRLGTNADFAKVCDNLHEAGIKVVLDGVFNHVGRGFWAFQDVLRNRENSPYKDWFYINFGGNDNYNDGLWYEGWEGHYELVKLNLKNPAVVEYLLSCVEGWMKEFKIDGLRLDVAYMVDGDFMRRLRSFCLERDPEFFLLGEMIHGDYHRIMNGEMLHSATNYECYKGLYSSFNSLNMFEMADSLQRQFGPENWTLYKGEHLLCFADNHDVSRIYTILSDKNTIYPLYAVLFCMPGIPCLYYGSEWGAQGDKAHGDDALRPYFEKPTENKLTEFVSKLAKIKSESKALCYGDFHNETLLNRQWIMKRSFEGETVLLAVNADSQAAEVSLKQRGEAVELLTGERVVLNGSVKLPPYGVKILKLK